MYQYQMDSSVFYNYNTALLFSIYALKMLFKELLTQREFNYGISWGDVPW